MNFLNVPLKNLVVSFLMLSSSFRQSDRSWDYFIFPFQIARIAISTDVKSADIAVMFRLFIFLSELDRQSSQVVAARNAATVASPLKSSSVSRLRGCFGRNGPDL